jgi:hypothetical protein
MNNDHASDHYGVCYKVEETDITLVPKGIAFVSYSRDVAESRMMKLFKESNCEKDFYLRDTITDKVVSYLLSKKTKLKHGIK